MGIRKTIGKALRKNEGSYDLYDDLKWKCRKIVWDLNFDRKLEKTYKKKTGLELNLEDPQTLNEKLQWMKKYWREPVAEICADKYAVRDYVKEKGLEHILTNLYGAFDSIDELDYSALPQRFVIKANHGCGMNIFCTNRNELDTGMVKKKLKQWMKRNYFYYSGEWVYKNIKPKIMIEEFLDGDEKYGLIDYKFFCCNGKPIYLYASYDRTGSKYKCCLYDMEWNKIPFGLVGHDPDSSIELAQPESFEDMKRYAEILSEPFPFSRIDFYNYNGRVVFGEITFFPMAGYARYEPADFGLLLGEKIQLPPRASDPEL